MGLMDRIRYKGLSPEQKERMKEIEARDQVSQQEERFKKADKDSWGWSGSTPEEQRKIDEDQ